MKRYLPLFLLVAGTLAAGPVHAILHELDLTNTTGEQPPQEVDPDERLSFKVVNLVPQFSYSIRVQRAAIPAVQTPPPPAGAGVPQGEADVCDPLVTLTLQIRRASEETEVADLVAKARERLAAKECPRPATVHGLEDAVSKTEKNLLDEFILKPNQLVKITVTRSDGKKEWVFVFTNSAGSWFTSYGFVFLGNQDKTFFAKEGDDGKFTITRKRDSGGALGNLNFAPSFFYTWLPRRDEVRNWSPGLTFGLGFNQSEPVVFAGGSLHYNRFVSLIAGAAIHKQKRLAGQYREGQTLSMTVDDNGLTEQKFGVNYFLGLSFRFNANPFSSGQDEAKPAEPAKPAQSSGGNP